MVGCQTLTWLWACNPLSNNVLCQISPLPLIWHWDCFHTRIAVCGRPR